jgi:hypothetical protein
MALRPLKCASRRATSAAITRPTPAPRGGTSAAAGEPDQIARRGSQGEHQIRDVDSARYAAKPNAADAERRAVSPNREEPRAGRWRRDPRNHLAAS